MTVNEVMEAHPLDPQALDLLGLLFLTLMLEGRWSVDTYLDPWVLLDQNTTPRHWAKDCAT